MAGSVSHKLNNSLEGALAGGGDPATSPLYVFGPFLKLIVVAGVAQVTFGASVWMAVFTIAVVSAMYRLVMRWVTDGSGGSGLSEEEFGGWAVKVNAAVTFIEYTLTFLVSMSAMVTFIADRIGVLNRNVLDLPFLQYRTIVAILLSILTGWLVNRGPKMAARTFGPATGGVLLLLWLMVFAVIWQAGGIRLPDFNLRAFTDFLPYTLGGYARILAVMTGIEVFANLVAAYEGPPNVKSRKAFNSLLIIMGTTSLTMLIVGPAIFALSDPTHPEISVFTQTMDALLPAPLPYLGTLVGIAVLMSASAASAQGLQNLFLGLRRRHYIPPILGQRNQYEVADKPVWFEVTIVSVCFLLFGTHEEVYLSLYAAGVFILLSMTGWAVTKRLIAMLKNQVTLSRIGLTVGITIAASLTTGATVIIFFERFFEGAWAYLLLIPVLYAMLTYARNQLGKPAPEMDYLGKLDAAQLAGFGFGQVRYASDVLSRAVLRPRPDEISWQPDPIERSSWRHEREMIAHVVVLLDGSDFAAQALPLAKSICRATNARLTLLSVVGDQNEQPGSRRDEEILDRRIYLQTTSDMLRDDHILVDFAIREGHTAEVVRVFVEENGANLVVTSTRGSSGISNWLTGGLSRKLVQVLKKPVLLVQPDDRPAPLADTVNALPDAKVKRILVALDGSIYSESTLPYARLLARTMQAELILLTVPVVPQVEDYHAPADVVEKIRSNAEAKMSKFLGAVARSLQDEGVVARPMVAGSIPTSTITLLSEEEQVDMIMLTTHGRGGLSHFMMGSVAERVVQNTRLPVFVIPVPNNLPR
jgi:nucleotide-binding universal stress UspA family protein